VTQDLLSTFTYFRFLPFGCKRGGIGSGEEQIKRTASWNCLDLSENPLQYINSYQESLTQVVYNLTGLQRLFLSNTPLKSLKYLYGTLGPQESGSYTARKYLLELDISFCAITTLSDVSSAEIFG
jgi:hypothetical protein